MPPLVNGVLRDYRLCALLYASQILFVFFIRIFIAMNGLMPHSIAPKICHISTVVPFS